MTGTFIYTLLQLVDTMKSIWNYFNCNQMHKYFHSPRDLVLYSGLRSTSEDVVQVGVMPLAFHFLRPRSPF